MPHSLTCWYASSREAIYGQLLAKYADDPRTLFIVSSDFCHWGTRFNYTFTDKSKVPPVLDISLQQRSLAYQADRETQS